MNTVQEKWEEYRKLSKKGVRKKDLERLAFYAGAAAVFNLVLQASEYSEEAGSLMLDMIQEEFQMFVAERNGTEP